MPWKAVTYRAVGGEVLHSLRRAEASGEGHPAWEGGGKRLLGERKITGRLPLRDNVAVKCQGGL